VGVEGVGGEASTNAGANSAYVPVLPSPRSPRRLHAPAYSLEIFKRSGPVSGPLRLVPGYTSFRAQPGDYFFPRYTSFRALTEVSVWMA